MCSVYDDSTFFYRPIDTQGSVVSPHVDDATTGPYLPSGIGGSFSFCSEARCVTLAALYPRLLSGNMVNIMTATFTFLGSLF